MTTAKLIDFINEAIHSSHEWQFLTRREQRQIEELVSRLQDVVDCLESINKDQL